MTTLEMIARETGVTARTVSNVLNGKNKEHWGSTARRANQIREVAERLGYQPNGAAKAVRSGRFGSVALLLSLTSNRSTVYQNMMNGLDDALRQHNLHLLVSRLADDVLTSDDFVPKVLREWLVDGLILNYNSNVPPLLATLLDKHKAPVIWTNSQRESDCVLPDDFEAGRKATEHLIEAGHKRIAFVAHSTQHYSREERCNGYFAAMQEANLLPSAICRECGIEGWAEMAQQWASQSDRPTAVVAYSPFTVQPILFGSLMGGLKVPEQLSLITFEESMVVDASTGRHITTCLLPEYEMGYSAVEMLIERIESGESLKPRLLTFNGIEGQTVVPPSQ